MANNDSSQIANKNPTAATWDDPNAGEDLIKAINDCKFYNAVKKSSNHKNADGYDNIALLAYDGDTIEGSDVGVTKLTPNLNAHSAMTTEDLACTSVAYTRKSLLSAGLTPTEFPAGEPYGFKTDDDNSSYFN